MIEGIAVYKILLSSFYAHGVIYGVWSWKVGAGESTFGVFKEAKKMSQLDQKCEFAWNETSKFKKK